MMKTFAEKRFFEWHEDDVSVTLRNKGGSYGGGSKVFVVTMVANSSGDDIAGTLDSSYYKGQGERQGIEREYVLMKYCIGNGQLDQLKLNDKVGALNCMHDQQAILEEGENMDSVVRRLTPTECERLQNFPDGWTLIGQPEEVEVKDYKCLYDDEGNIVEKILVGTHTETEYFYTDSNGKKKKCSDTARFKALGNSIALPYWFYILRRISAQYERPATLGSLFDGIGGFPLCWTRCNGVGSVKWSSEIEEFPMAVVKKHFGDEDEGIEGDIRNYL